MNDENDMPRKTISMNKQESDQLDTMAKKEHRSVSKQIVHMMEFYIENKDKAK